MIRFSELIRQKRRKAGLTQEQLAEQIGVSVGYIGKIEAGLQEPGIRVTVKLMKALNIKDSEIPHELGNELMSSINMLSERLGNLDNKFASLHPRVKSFLLAIAPQVEEYM